MAYALFGLACFGVVTSSVFAHKKRLKRIMWVKMD